MARFTETPSPELIEANRCLLERRAQVQAQRQTSERLSEPAGSDGSLPPWASAPAPSDGDRKQQPALLPHLGWGSAAVTATLRRRQEKAVRADETAAWQAAHGQGSPSNSDESTPMPRKTRHTTLPQRPRDATGSVKLYPTIGLAMLREEQTAAGRLWLMLRYLDAAGRGWLDVAELRDELTKKGSPLRLCGRRQLRNLLKWGQDIYWTYDGERIWLRSAAKVAYALGVERLSGWPVALPAAALVAGIGDFRAHLYAAFHSSRVKETARGSEAMPIARDTLAALSGVGRSSQRAYEERADVDVQANYAVGEQVTEEDKKERAWQKGHALFEFKDHRGKQGKKGRTYLAWQLPNSYVSGHRRRPRGRQRRINRELKDLVMKGMPGNVDGTVDLSQPVKRYYPNGLLAAKAFNRRPEREICWRRGVGVTGRLAVWLVMGGE